MAEDELAGHPSETGDDDGDDDDDDDEFEDDRLGCLRLLPSLVSFSLSPELMSLSINSSSSLTPNNRLTTKPLPPPPLPPPPLPPP